MRKSIYFCVIVIVALVAIPAALAGGSPKAMVLTLADVQSVPDCVAGDCSVRGAELGFGNMSSGFRAKTAKAAIVKSKNFGRIKTYEAKFTNTRVPDGYSGRTLRLVWVQSNASVYASPAIAEKAWTDRVSFYAKNSDFFDDMGSVRRISKQAKLYSTQLLDQSGFFLFWRSGNVLALLSVNKTSDIEYDGLAANYVLKLAKVQQARIVPSR
jgi:hypothetical protein